MSAENPDPTPFPAVNAILRELLAGIREVLASHFIGMYLDGSLTSGDFDQDSDIDFLVVTDAEITCDQFPSLQAMHARIAALDSPWSIQLEGSYLSQEALRRYDPSHDLHPNIERGPGERLKLAVHGEPWNIHRSILRQRGITLAGPHPASLIDPVSPGDLRQAMLSLLRGWGTNLLQNPQAMSSRGYQSYVVLSLCRILYTLKFGEVASKRTAASWAQEISGRKWQALIDRAWEGRHHPQMPANPREVEQTRQYIQYVIDFND